MRRAALLLLPLLLLAFEGLAQSARDRVVAAALAQVGVTTTYDASYRSIPYPGGDVPLSGGVCTDVVIRAFRAIAVDLQVLVHEDMRANFSAYPRNWGLRRPDRNIDHRRVPNLQTLFSRKGLALPVTARAADYAAGDVVTWMLPGNLPHIGIVSSTRTRLAGRPLIIHNIGSGAQHEDVLFAWKITGHYRWKWPGAVGGR